ncbi:MAG: putative rane protein, partial [Firmicutes bacterium]|nr:putative rane protein [Bacillota bacterium]
MEFFKELFSREVVRRAMFLVSIAVIIYLLGPMTNLMLLTFVFAFLMNSAQGVIVKHLKKITPVKEKLVTGALYLILFVCITLAAMKYFPLLIKEVTGFLNDFSVDYLKVGSPVIDNLIAQAIQEVDLNNYIKSGVNLTIQLASKVGSLSLQAFIAMILSMFFILEKKKVFAFLEKFKDSKLSGFYKYFSFYGENFLNTFGKVMQAQILIAIINSIISVCMLYVLGFPNLATLWIMILLLSLIPVAGVIVSLIPLSIIAFKIGGLAKVVSVLIMIALVHGFESYVLNPKLMSAKVELPIFFTFIILLFAEHL